MDVTAKPGTRCPKEKKPREYIDDRTAVTVPETSYYRRLLADGSLVRVPAKVDKAEKKGAKA